MPTLPQSLEGLDQFSLLVGVAFGFVLGITLHVMVTWYRWTVGMLRRRYTAQEDIDEIREESRTSFRSGLTTGCPRVILYFLIVAAAAWYVTRMWRMGAP
jgi:ribose/xylose/arabinose/galactoside ABC-type transport system permease subunit